MKTWLWIVGSGLILALLVFRLIYVKATGVDHERIEYIANLHYNFSAAIDSARMMNNEWGDIFFHVTKGEFDPGEEPKLNQQLKYNRSLRLFVRRGRVYVIGSRMAKSCETGDSLVVNSDQGRMWVYRKGEKMMEAPLLLSLRGRPF